MGKPAERQYEFVNATKPGRNLDDDVRKLVRTHVMNEHIRDKKRKKAVPKKSSSLDSTPTPPRSSPGASGQSYKVAGPPWKDYFDHPIGHPSALCLSPYPVEMRSRTHALLSTYMTFVTRRLPLARYLKTNPLGASDWFHFAVTDEAMFHALLYAGATHTALLQGKTESEDTVFHLGRTISIVNERLRGGGPVDDSTIGSLTCLALGEARTGNLDVWHIHMRGLKQMIRTRGSIFSLSSMLQMKLRITDVAGAIDYAATPYLDFERSVPPIWSTLPPETLESTRKHITKLLTTCGIHHNLINTMSELASFTQAIQDAKCEPSSPLDPTAFIEDMYWIEYKLLSFPTTLPKPSEEEPISRACRLGALLYMKNILQEFPHSVTGPSILLNQLQDSLHQVTDEESCSPLVLWLSLVGVSLSSRGMNKEWFIDRLVSLAAKMGISSFNDEEMFMSRVLPLQDLLGRSLNQLWVDSQARC